MRTLRALVAVAALTTAAPAVAAAPRAAAITDPARDWVVESQDILRVRLDTTRVGGIPAVRAVLTLAGTANPDGYYAVTFKDDCHTWSVLVGALQRTEPTYRHTSCLDESGRKYSLGWEDTSVAMAEMSGNEVTLLAFFNDTLQPGARVVRLTGHAGYRPSMHFDTTVRSLGHNGWVGPGDRAEGAISLVLR